MDFTLDIYKKLLVSLKNRDSNFQTFDEYITAPKKNVIILRHDVDLLPKNSLAFAQIQNDLGIKGVYYFRAVPESWDESIIKEIGLLGHEIGYHYESLTTTNGNIEKGIEDFTKNLELLRGIARISTICMHGSPASKFDSKDLWKTYSYRDWGIIGEPYFDVDFNNIFYITDTGRRWDGNKVSVRDKVSTTFELSFHNTNEIIESLERDKFPKNAMFTFHPQRWTNQILPWVKELVLQNTKNIIKKHLFVK